VEGPYEAPRGESPQALITVPIELDSFGDESSTSFSFSFNATVFTYVSSALGPDVPAGSNLGTNINELASGRLGVLIDSTNTYVAGTRRILSITLSYGPSATIGNYPVTFGNSPTPQSISTSQGALLPALYVPGVIRITGTTAAGVEVSGRVLTVDGRGLRNAVVSIIDMNGVRRTATTSSFGYYRFDDVEAGSTHLFSVSSKRYRYTPHIVQVFDTLTDVDFVGIE